MGTAGAKSTGRIEMKEKTVNTLIIIVMVLVPIVDLLTRNRGPNVILVSFDTTRADHIGCYGYKDAHTPNIDGLAAAGIRFENAFTPVPVTLPSHTTMFTGLLPPEHGVRNNGMFSLGEVPKTLAEAFKEKGYHTAAFPAAIVLDSRYGLARGFDFYDDDMLTGAIKAGPLGNRELRAGEVTRRVISWLRNNRRKSFFLFVHYFDPHQPFDPPDPWNEMFADSPYDGEIAYADEQFGVLLDELRTQGLDKKTIIFLVGDHGEGLGEHGERTHSTFVYNSTVRVPLIISLPGDKNARVVKENVSLADLAPTIASLAGLGSWVWNADSRSLIENSVPAALPVNRPIYLETWYNFYAHGWSPLEGVVRGEFKYVSAPNVELYDIENDPHELENLAADDSVRTAAMQKALESVRSRMQQSDRAVARKVSHEEERGLRALGYVGSSGNRELPQDISILPDPKEMIHTFGKYMLGVTFMTDGRLDLAAREFGNLLQEDTANVSVAEFLAETELLRGKPESAQKALNRAFATGYPTSRTYFLAGMASLDLADSTAALKAIDESLALDSLYSPALEMKGRLLRDSGDYAGALDYLEQAVKQSPDSPDMLTDLGICLIGLRELDRAEKVLVHALELDPSDWQASYNLGLSYHYRGQREKALKCYEQAAGNEKASREVFNNLGICYYELKDYSSAVDAYRHALEIDHVYPEGWNNLAGALTARGKDKDAASAYVRALELDPGYADAWLNYGLLLGERFSLPDSAAACLNRGINIDPANPRNELAHKYLHELNLQSR